MEKSEAIEKLERQRTKLAELRASDVEDPAFQKWERDTRLTVSYVFGEESNHVSEFNDLPWTPSSYSMYDPDPAFARAFTGGRQSADALLQSMIDEITEYWDEPTNPEVKSVGGATPASNKVFLVHGQSVKHREQVARFLEKLNLETVVLRELPNKGRTIIEKFEDHSDVSFAVVLLTADDRGGPSNAPYKEQSARARQNVLLELGFFLGHLGRENVCVLYEDGVEIPSDYRGVAYTLLDEHDAWKLELAREAKAAGFPIDLNNVF